MNRPILVVLAALSSVKPAGASGIDPCAPLTARVPDAAIAAQYRAIADAELGRGARDTAAVAYHAAAERDPRDASSRTALARLCAEGGDFFAQGVARLDAGDPRGALRALAAARVASAAPSPALVLLEGIAHVELGEDAQAEPLLRQAEASPEQRGAARLFLGILRLRTGDAAGAAALFDAAAGTPGFSRAAADLGRLARRDGRLVLSLLVDSAWDSNVTVAPPDGSPGPESDAAAGIAAAVLWRPLGPSGPYARASGSLQKQLTLGDYDFTALDAAAGWQHQARSLSLAAEYDLASRTLGGEAYLTAHRLLASLVLGRRTTLAAVYSVRFESYADGFDDFSGVVHRGELRLGLPLGSRIRVGLSYLGARDVAEAADLSYLEHGPRADLWIAAASRLRLGLEGGLTLRRYDRADPTLGVVRDDVIADGLAVAELDLGAHLTARLAVQARRATSSSGTWEYSKLVPSLGLLWMTGY